jgi:glycerol uptake facilitator-like aquaporin
MAVMLAVFAVSRWPGLLPPNFSVAYALVFCVGAFFGTRIAWGWTLGVMLGTDLLLNCYYQFVNGYEVFTPRHLLYQAMNYAGYALLWWLGRAFRNAAKKNPPGREGLATMARSWLALLGGGLLGAVLFYLITNTASWLINPFGNPEYSKDLAGWLAALTTGTQGHPPTWEFFRNTLLSGGLFTGLFSAAAMSSDRLESAQEKEAANATANAEEEEREPAVEEAKAQLCFSSRNGEDSRSCITQ